MTSYQQFSTLYSYMSEKIIGQAHLCQRFIIALLADGHILAEGAPGLAKTRAACTLALCLSAAFARIQFTPDLLPGDLTGTDIYKPGDGTFNFRKGPLFNNIILADEINRAPAKVQSALLESMAERQISIGNKTYTLPELFLVMATQNSLEQEGTYPLPEAQLDRFLMKVHVRWPSIEDEKRILQLTRREQKENGTSETVPVLTPATVLQARQEVLAIHMAPPVEDYIVRLIDSTRHKSNGSSINTLLLQGAGPRATQALDRCSRAHAWLNGRNFVSPEDVRATVYDVLQHRLKLNFEAIAEGYTVHRIIRHMLNKVSIC